MWLLLSPTRLEAPFLEGEPFAFLAWRGLKGTGFVYLETGIGKVNAAMALAAYAARNPVEKALLFGLAFHALGIGLLRHATGDAADSVAVFTLSYLAGFLALIAPGGIGVREGVMALLLTRAGIATPSEATWLVVASRLWLTVLEILPGAALLAVSPRRRSSDPSRHSA